MTASRMSLIQHCACCEPSNKQTTIHCGMAILTDVGGHNGLCMCWKFIWRYHAKQPPPNNWFGSASGRSVSSASELGRLIRSLLSLVWLVYEVALENVRLRYWRDHSIKKTCEFTRLQSKFAACEGKGGGVPCPMPDFQASRRQWLNAIQR